MPRCCVCGHSMLATGGLRKGKYTDWRNQGLHGGGVSRLVSLVGAMQAEAGGLPKEESKESKT